MVEKWNKLLFYPTLYEGFEFSNNIIYTGAAPNQNSVQLAEFMTANFGARVYLIGSDYIYPYESNRIMGELVLQRQDSASWAKRYVALNATERDYREILDDIRNKRPDFIFSTVVGNSTACLYRAYADAGFDPKTMPIASLTTSEAELSQMEPAVAGAFHVGAVLPVHRFRHQPALPGAIAAALRRGLRAQPVLGGGLLPDAHLRQRLPRHRHRRDRADPAARAAKRILGAAGRVRIDPTNHHTCLYPRVGRVNAKGQFTIVREATRPVHPDPYLVTHSLGDWTATLSSLEI